MGNLVPINKETPVWAWKGFHIYLVYSWGTLRQLTIEHQSGPERNLKCIKLTVRESCTNWQIEHQSGPERNHKLYKHHSWGMLCLLTIIKHQSYLSKYTVGEPCGNIKRKLNRTWIKGIFLYQVKKGHLVLIDIGTPDGA